MPVMQQNVYKQKLYYQLETSNQSFLDMHYFLKDIGIQNNKYFLVLYDSDLAGVNPRDPNLSLVLKQKILRECMINFWYFAREVVRIPDQGNPQGVKYQLHRGNLALNFGFLMNWNIFLELPRQNFKTVSALVYYLWVFNYATSNSEMMFMNKKHEDSKRNLQTLKNLRDMLPSYLQLNAQFGMDGKRLKVRDSVETLEHSSNKNNIRTMASARNKQSAQSLGRGCTQPIQWYDEHAFIPYVSEIYSSATPAYSRAAHNARVNNAPYGILITTTPGFKTEDSGLESWQTKEDATKFIENHYDWTYQRLNELLNRNTNSKFVHMRFSYQQLGRDEEYFRDMVRELKGKWADIRREILLEWASGSDNSPFSKDDLNIVEGLVREPINSIILHNYYNMDIYDVIQDQSYPPIVGVDVSGGYRKDSSAITVIDSRTTKVIATFNNNYISIPDLAAVIYELVTKFMPNSIVNVERNGGFGHSVLAHLIKSKIKNRLYFEIKDRVTEERYNGMVSQKKTQKLKIYGLDSTKNIRDLMMEILRERMTHHKDKFIARIIFDELQTLEVKRNGRIEHASNCHDDQIFSYLLALYVWYEGQNLMENFGLSKNTIKTDQDLDSSIIDLEDKYGSILEDINQLEDEELHTSLEKIDDHTITYLEHRQQEYDKDQNSLNILLQNKVAARAYAIQNGLEYEDIKNGVYTIPNSVYNNFYDE